MSDSIDLTAYRKLLAEGANPRVRRRAHPEEDLQRACFDWLGLIAPKNPILRWAFHYPAGGKRPKGEAGKLKAMGTKPGVPDVMLPRPWLGWQGLAIELKSATGTVSDDQWDWLHALEADGYLTAVCRTLEEFQAVVMRFLVGRHD